jgi:putative Mn2+ efflux pump MntP
VNSGLLALLLSVLPLGMDTFVIAAVVGGTSRLAGWVRWRISVIFVVFEGGMPLVGLALGASVGNAIGSIADYLSGGLLIALAGYLWWAEHDDDDDDDDDGEVAKARRLCSARGLALLGLALSISLDELAIGFGLGLGARDGPGLVRPVVIVAALAIQTLIVSQLGLVLGSRISNRFRERIEQLTSPGLACLGCYQVAETLLDAGLISVLDTVVGALLILTVPTVILSRRLLGPGTHRVAQPRTHHALAVTASPGPLNDSMLSGSPLTNTRASWPGHGRHRVAKHGPQATREPDQDRWLYTTYLGRGRLIRVNLRDLNAGR